MSFRDWLERITDEPHVRAAMADEQPPSIKRRSYYVRLIGFTLGYLIMTIVAALILLLINVYLPLGF